MKHRRLNAGALAVFAFVSPLSAQGVPTFDGTQLTQLVAQVEHMAKDLNVQLEQVATMRQELETQIRQLTNLDAQLRSLIESSGMGQLLASIEDFKRLRGAIELPIDTLRNITSGRFAAAFPDKSDLKDSLRRVLTGAGFSEDQLAELSASSQPAHNNLALQAGASAMLSVAAEESHREAGESLDRIQTMVGHIDEQEGIKAAMDLNTRMTAELGIILTQMWRLEATSGISAGQLGVVDAATLAAERKFRTMAVDK